MKLRPPVVAGLWLLGAIALDRAVATDQRAAQAGSVPRPLRAAGALPAVAGVGLAVWALGLFSRRGTTYEPFEAPTALVESGPYRYTRNPMYVGILLCLAGVALLAGRWTLLLAPVGFFFTIDRGQIRREEAVLEETFGEAYRAYRQRVPRWLSPAVFVRR